MNRRRCQAAPRLPRNASALARFRVLELRMTQRQAADLHGWCERRWQTIEADYRQMRPYEADHIARRCSPRVGRDIDPYVEFAAWPVANPDRQSAGAGGGLLARARS